MQLEKLKRPRVKIIFLFAALSLIALSILSFVRIKNLIKASELVTHTINVKLELEHTFQALLQAESSQRGYLNTKDSVFIVDCYAALTDVERYINNVDSLTKDDASQQQNLIILRGLVDKRVAYLKSVANDAANSTIPLQRLLSGKVLMDEVHARVIKMELEEKQ